MKDQDNRLFDVIGAEFVISIGDLKQMDAPAYAEVAIAGRSNVGKSSMINRLTQRKNLAKTSGTPGRTRTVNIFRVQLRCGVMDLVDLPGYGYAKASRMEKKRWAPLIEGFLRSRAGLRGTVVLVDIRRGLQSEELQLIDFVHSLKQKALIVCTKIDKLATSQRNIAIEKIKRSLPDKLTPVIGFSALSGQGHTLVWKHLCELANLGAESTLP